MKKLLSTLFILFISFSMNSQTIFGKWNTVNDETGEVDSVIEVYKKNGKAYAKILQINDPEKQKAICEKCDAPNKDKPILGLEILTGLEKNDKEWSGGEILDPRNGKVYKCYIKLVKPDKLKIRGYLGLSLFGKTKYWQRAK
ncbi:hypothetical protein BW723_13500 [Polaribacter reichenbachii]|uniref:DUF2147 domain-containing protein n=1 Tax=Polaribacter reichenbachii TaxID=996801 RepID=A0A1B8U1P9_9FLAO|nr:DUF2147 domain-containing protein [Polaribacter reichenbachii]APZ47235.1 hypothetical protein BW723_13500 [Polaribacter reichenbachii]AUC17876.1 hypothetical protein BTO17_03955 [Polaribacter reichenbachii]OBY65800.1 hypothetical protein LPB301_08280 [Polaribacter reichenbachii]